MNNYQQAKHSDQYYQRTDAFLPVFKVLKEQICKTEDKILLMGLKGSLDMSLRTWSGTYATFISKALWEHFKKKKYEINPFELKWENRDLFDKAEGSEKNIAVWEHTLPIKQLRDNIITCTSEIELENLVKNYPGIARITREEDERLTKLKFRQSRPEGFLNCYKCKSSAKRVLI
jgi:hypothetical protein